MKRFATILLLAGTFVLAGCGDSENFVFTNTNPIQQLPIAVNDTYNTDEDTQLSVNATNGVLANDTPNGGTITAFDSTSTQGGTVNVNASGAFTYTPDAGFTGPDTFTYTVTNGAGSSSATVTITVNVVNGFFVDAVNGDDMTGSFQGGNPFQTIQAAVAAAPTNADIVVRPGNYTGAVNLKDGQRLLGSGSGLAVNPQGAVRPETTGPIVLADGNTVDFIRIENAPDDSIDGANQASGTISNCEIINSGDLGICLQPTTGDWNVSNNTIDGTGALGLGIVCSPAGTQLVTFRITDNVIENCDFGAIGTISASAENARFLIQDNSTTGTTNPGATIQLLSGDTSTTCAAIIGNFNDDAYQFGQMAGSFTNIERLSQLTAINSGGATVTTAGGFDPATEVVEGFCNF